MINRYTILAGKPEGKRSCKTTRRGWENNISMNLGKTVWDDVDWIYLGQDRKSVAVSSDHGNEPEGSIRGEQFLD
jgi:hypothetical protein